LADDPFAECFEQSPKVQISSLVAQVCPTPPPISDELLFAGVKGVIEDERYVDEWAVSNMTQRLRQRQGLADLTEATLDGYLVRVNEGHVASPNCIYDCDKQIVYRDY
jgi:hypothetical protein